jgi:alpha-mannosidase
MSTTNNPHTVFVTLGTHCDLFWMGTHTECLERGMQIQRHALDLMEQHPEYCYYIETTIFADYHLRQHPEDMARMQRFVDEGRLEVGACFVDRIEHLHGGESIIRHAVEGSRWLDETFGPGTREAARTAAHPDLPGLSPQVPQIYAQAGIKAYLHARGIGSVYRWEAPDGSTVVYCNLFGYGQKSVQDYERVLQKTDLPGLFVVRGGFTDLQDANDQVLEVAREVRRTHPDVDLRFASPGRVMGPVSDQPLPRLSGEMPFGWGSPSSAFVTIMQQSAELEHALLTLEKVTALASLAGQGAQANVMAAAVPTGGYWKLRRGVDRDLFGDPISAGKELREGWRYELLCQDHNYAGRHGAQSNWDKENYRTHVLEVVALRTEQGLHSLAGPGEGERLVAFNPTSWPRDEVMILPDDKPETLCVMAPDGRALPAQPVNGGLAVQAHSLPPLTAQTFTLARGEARVTPQQMVPHLISDHLAVDVDVEKGQVNRLFDRVLGRDLIDARGGRGLGELLSYKDPGVDVRYGFTGEVESDAGAGYHLVRREEGEVFSRITVSGTFLQSVVEKEYTVYKAMRRMDVTLRVWWWGKRGEHLRLRFPFAAQGHADTWYGVPFYAMRWPDMLHADGAVDDSVLGQAEGFADMLDRDDRLHFREVIGWLDVGYGAHGAYGPHGVAVGTRSTCWWVAGPELQASLLRTQYSCGDTDLWSLNPGLHEWHFRLQPHAGDWREGKAYRVGEEMLNPLAISRCDSLAGQPALAPPAGLRVEPDNVLVTAFKPSDFTDGALILRVLECEGRACEARVQLPFAVRRASLVDLMERETGACTIEGGGIAFALRPHQFQTLNLTGLPDL